MITATLDGGTLVVESMWQTREGRRMRLSEMDDQHVANAKAMLERNFEETRGVEQPPHENPVAYYTHNIGVLQREQERREQSS